MNKPSLNILSRIYLLAILLAAAVLSPLPYLPLTIILLGVILWSIIRPPLPHLSIVIMVATIFLQPQVLAPFLQYFMYAIGLPPITGDILPIIATLPAMYLLDCALRQNALTITLIPLKEVRTVTAAPRAMLTATTVMLLVSLFLSNRVLLFASITLMLYLSAIVIWVVKAVPRQPLNIPDIGKRIIAHTTSDIFLHVTSKAAIRLYCQLSPMESWVTVSPQRLTLNGDKIGLNFTLTPPLAGSIRPKIQASMMDPRGFIQVNQTIEPIELHVIPRARYAEWLAIRYLEQTGGRTTVPITPPASEILARRTGIEYYDSRYYQPGDRLKDIDWKHTLKLSRLITKEYSDIGAQSAIIAVNLAVADGEGADKLAFNLITTALTLARQAIPSALAAYNQEKVAATTVLTDPQEMLKQTLLLVKEITTVTVGHRYLQPPDISKLKRNITLLKQVPSKPAQQLLSMLNIEYQAIEQATKNNPAAVALLQVAGRVSPPAVIILLSQLNGDNDVLTLIIEKLKARGFNILSIDT